MTEDAQRHYVHGDQKEDDAEMRFCRRCDAFVPKAHFAEGHHKKQKLSEYERYLEDKEHFAVKMKNRPGKWRRPPSSPNYFA